MCIISSKLLRVVIDANSSFMFFFVKSLVFIFSSSQTQSAERDRWINLSLEASNEVSQKKCSFFFKCGGGGVCSGRLRVVFCVTLDVV